jgi:hypothetical protein
VTSHWLAASWAAGVGSNVARRIGDFHRVDAAFRPDYCGAGMDGGSAVARQRIPVSVAPFMKAMQLGL